MSDVHTYSSDVAFTPAVKAIQARKGSRESYAHVEARGGWRTIAMRRVAAHSQFLSHIGPAIARAANGRLPVAHRRKL